MSSTNLTVPIPDALLPALQSEARNAGVEPELLIQAIVTRALTRHPEQKEETLEDIFGPVRDEVEASGITDEELMELFEEARRSVPAR